MRFTLPGAHDASVGGRSNRCANMSAACSRWARMRSGSAASSWCGSTGIATADASGAAMSTADYDARVMRSLPAILLCAMLESAAPAQQSQPDGWTPLHRAAAAGDVAAIRTALQSGVNVDAPLRIDDLQFAG